MPSMSGVTSIWQLRRELVSRSGRMPSMDSSITSASPVLANGHLYFTNEAGTTYTIQVGDELKVVATNELKDFTVASPVLLDGRIYLRTDKYLWCIAEKSGS